MTRQEQADPVGLNWTEAEARQAAQRMLSQAGVEPAGLELLRFGNNGVFKVRDCFIIRVARPTTPAEVTKREVQVTQALRAAGVPVVRLVDLPVEQPLVAGGCLGTIWDYIPGEQPTYRQFGDLVRRFHQTDLLAIDLPEWQPLATARQRLDALADQYPNDDIALLNNWYERIVIELDSLRSILRRGIIHGQAEINNALVHDGTSIFLDLERVCIGPREWDLIDTAASILRFDRPQENYQNFAEAYGFDVMRWSGFDTLRRVWELRATTWLMQAYTHSAARSDEVRIRIDTWRDDVPMKVWRGF
ncbi:MAG: aminoglycoside phosphotransferase family protein [Actinomycetota bacterium]|nr:aminoglycoside phosphotransferase family protein [Actinomycetota bacterium]